ncbi:MAG: twin-arginine translocase subunit TatC [Galactobacter sp.]|uniref:twin-arginine translocase subunit TatC n=1 Tax=Galactobacter sp. TaxID=2676125 RepID=UPI0025BD290C|nr:twin-arginine translocase subunit TatC [Galactobacter sp.]
MPLKAHLKEARNRLFVSLGVVLVTTVAAVFFYKPVLGLIVALVEDAGGDINYQTAISPLDIAIKVSLWLGIIAASPVLLYQVWAFIVPGLQKRERRISLAFIAATIPLFLGGVVLGVLVIPHALRFFFGLTPDGGLNIVNITDFLPFVTRLTLAFGVAMVIPVMMVGLNVIGILPARSILKHWRIIVFLIAVFSAIAAPGGDAMSMLVMAGPMLILFAAATGLCYIFDRRKAKRAAKTDVSQASEIEVSRPLEEL